MTTRRLPNGTYTENADIYCDAWENEVLKPLEALGYRIMGFDPGVLVADAYNPSTSAVSLPMWVVRKILGR
jgi:hypothetical protein